METKRAAIYARVSTTKGQPLENQLTKLREVAAKAGDDSALAGDMKDDEE